MLYQKNSNCKKIKYYYYIYVVYKIIFITSYIDDACMYNVIFAYKTTSVNLIILVKSNKLQNNNVLYIIC